ncbi:methylated-DNA--[protein]-cysteine S-methyltransferase [Halobacteriovorax sp. HFRX-2_2]|uniref:methylated-DNA--[protein]-cysteine S-methyltransferase n=1 Tax=Halobacteriovorax sp. HFRX-2_2 TaxID=3157717 RepID=UPI003711EAA9
MTDRQIEFHSKFGTIYICANENGVSYLGWEDQEYDGPHYEDNERIAKYLNEAHDQLEEYFAGSRKKFSIPLSINKGTDFQKQVWAQLLDIPYGEVTTYSDIAQKVGSPNAVQAVGSANAKNPICLIIPCHRVIAKSGELSGYVAGADIKEALLNHEGGMWTLFDNSMT